VFGNRVLRRIFGPKRVEITGKWRKLHIEELNDMYCSQNIIRLIKSRRMRWTGHGGEERFKMGLWRGNLRERDHLENRGVGGKIILTRIFRKWDVGAWNGSSWLRIGTGGGLS